VAATSASAAGPRATATATAGVDTATATAGVDTATATAGVDTATAGVDTATAGVDTATATAAGCGCVSLLLHNANQKHTKKIKNTQKKGLATPIK
jgi:hypothetical protein